LHATARSVAHNAPARAKAKRSLRRAVTGKRLQHRRTSQLYSLRGI